jgi:hypothetical protein
MLHFHFCFLCIRKFMFVLKFPIFRFVCQKRFGFSRCICMHGRTSKLFCRVFGNSFRAVVRKNKQNYSWFFLCTYFNGNNGGNISLKCFIVVKDNNYFLLCVFSKFCLSSGFAFHLILFKYVTQSYSITE